MTGSEFRPIIGVTRCSATTDYVASIQQAGGEPVVLEHDGDPAEALGRIDGLLLTGGPDVDPGEYGASAHPTSQVNAVRDRFELPLTRLALERDVPLLAICRGVQVLNVVGGGTLLQDLPSEATSILDHSVDTTPHAIAHAVHIEPDTRLARLLAGGPTAARKACDSEVCVNSRHHQAVKDIAPGFIVSAVAPDGTIEAIEKPEARFCLGVQWHPENFHRTGEFTGVFAGFVESCARKGDS